MIAWRVRVPGRHAGSPAATRDPHPDDDQPEVARFLADHDALSVVVAALGHARRQTLARTFAQERARHEVSDPPRAALCQAIVLLLLEGTDDR